MSEDDLFIKENLNLRYFNNISINYNISVNYFNNSIVSTNVQNFQ
jgi:hypothetical protein